jgi:hypothetical protein
MVDNLIEAMSTNPELITEYELYHNHLDTNRF